MMKKFSILVLSLAVSGVSFAKDNQNKSNQNTLVGCAETQTLCFFGNGKYIASPMGFKGDFLQSGEYTVKKLSAKQSEIRLTSQLPYQAFELFTRSNVSVEQGQFELMFDRSSYDQDEKKDYYDSVELLGDKNNSIKTFTFAKSDNVLLNIARPIQSVILTKYDKATQQPLYTETYRLEKNANDIVIKSAEIDEIFYRAKNSSATLKLIKNGSQSYLQETKHKVKLLSPAQLGENKAYFDQYHYLMESSEESDSLLYKNAVGNVHILPDSEEWDNYVYDEKTAIYTHKNPTEHSKKFPDKKDDNSVLKVYILNKADNTKVYPISK